MCRLSVDHRNFTRTNVDQSFKCRTQYRILFKSYRELVVSQIIRDKPTGVGQVGASA